MNLSLATIVGAAVGAIVVALIAWWGNRSKNSEEVKPLYVTASDLVVDNLTDEVTRLGSEIHNLRIELNDMRGRVRSLGGDPWEGYGYVQPPPTQD